MSERKRNNNRPDDKQREPVKDLVEAWENEMAPLMDKVQEWCDEHDVPMIFLAHISPDGTMSVRATGMSVHATPLAQLLYGILTDQVDIAYPIFMSWLAHQPEMPTMMRESLEKVMRMAHDMGHDDPQGGNGSSSPPFLN